MKLTIFFPLLCLTLCAQAQDTLFYKHFNDLNFATDPRATIYIGMNEPLRIVSTANSPNYIDGSPALAFNYGGRIAREVLYSFLPRNQYYPYEVALKAVPLHDTIKVSLTTRAKLGLYSGDNTLGIALAPQFSVFYFYSNSATSKNHSKSYQVQNSQLFCGLTFGNYTPYVTISEDANLVEKKKFTLVYIKNKYPFVQFSIHVTPSSSPRTFYVGLSSGQTALAEQDIVPAMLADFCAGTDNPTDCQLKANFSLMPFQNEVDYKNDVLIDNLSIVGINKQVVTGLEENELAAQAQEIEQAYTLMGTEIEDYAHYTGVAIERMKDGSRRKICK